MVKFKNIAVVLLLATGLFTSPRLDAISAQNPVKITVEQGTLSAYTGERIMLQYCYENVPFKPYARQLFSPNGVNVLRDAPSDHLHHHGLMFAVAVEGVNFWEEHHSPGRQAHQAFNESNVSS